MKIEWLKVGEANYVWYLWNSVYLSQKRNYMKKIKSYFDIIAVLASLTAILISVKSCTISTEALKLSETEFIGESKLYLGCKLNKNNTTVSITPLSSNTILQKAGINFPAYFELPETFIREADSTISLIPVRTKLQQFIKKEAINFNINEYVHLPYSQVPVVIQSYYISKGYPKHEMALYLIDYSAKVSSRPAEEPIITFHGIIFSSNIDDSIDIDQYVTDCWEATKRGVHRSFERGLKSDK